jgi:hypothetical protein
MNLPGGRLAMVRYAPIAAQIPHRSETTLCAESIAKGLCGMELKMGTTVEYQCLDYLIMR